jgi:uncharacterized lipoprotein YajG
MAMTVLRISTALWLGLLAGCSTPDLAVRNGPQAVHPSTSALASGGSVVVTGAAQPTVVSANTVTVGDAVIVLESDTALAPAPAQTLTYTPGPLDGSQPIID